MHPPIDETVSEPRDAPTAFWLTPMSYWSPVHLPVSAWYTHTSFAAWLMDALRPTRVVELGTHFGCSCFAFAEAAKRLGHGCAISAIDTWEGDDHAGFYGAEVFDYVAEVARTDYPASVGLVRATFEEARAQFPDGSVDLLHIDGRHAYEDVVADYEIWRSSVRDGGSSSSTTSASARTASGSGGSGRRSPNPAEVASLCDDVAGLTGDIAERDRSLADRAAHIDQIHASTSWRITAPVRWVGRLRRPPKPGPG